MRIVLSLSILAACVTGAEGPDLDSAAPSSSEPIEHADGFGLHDTAGPMPGLPAFTYVRTPDAAHCGGIAVAMIRDATAQVPADEPELAALFAMEFPRGLDFAGAREESMNRFSSFLEETKARATTAMKVYEARGTSGDESVQLGAGARRVQILRFFAGLLLRAEVPAEIRTGEHAAEKTDAYCDSLASAAEPLLVQAKEQAAMCLKLGAKHPAGWWTPVCVP